MAKHTREEIISIMEARGDQAGRVMARYLRRKTAAEKNGTYIGMAERARLNMVEGRP